MLCQSCIERQLEPNEAIGLFKGFPICDSCLGPMMDNLITLQDTNEPIEESFEDRKAKALKMFSDFISLTENFPLNPDELLLCRDDFFNFRAHALVNLDLKQLQEIITRRTSVLYSIKIETEKIAELIDRIKADERSKVKGLSIEKALASKGKVINARSNDDTKLAKIMAKSLNISLESALELIKSQGAAARQKEFKGIVNYTDNVPEESTGSILKALQKEIKREAPSKVIKRCQVCMKITCICRK